MQLTTKDMFSLNAELRVCLGLDPSTERLGHFCVRAASGVSILLGLELQLLFYFFFNIGGNLIAVILLSAVSAPGR